ncbi:hypothetical protein [Chitinophaga defluvii]|uniref:Lipoprotein n=1 Tax=Chitinophaga defluvii TaxID=3163343 RepID=A0ABV2T6P1_9BACT
MKTILIFITGLLLVAGCNEPKLDNAMAADILKAEQRYPRAVDYDLYCADPTHARRVLEGGLEEKGLLTVARSQELGDAGAPLIQLTAAAKPYLLETSDKDKAIHVQKVKLADEVLDNVQSVSLADDGKSATVSYSTCYTNFTPFNVLRTAPKDNKAYTVAFILTNKGWQVERKK